MTAEEFVEKYKGQRVRVNENYKYNDVDANQVYVVDWYEWATDTTCYVIVKDHDWAYAFAPNELDVFDDKPKKVIPLPLPG